MLPLYDMTHEGELNGKYLLYGEDYQTYLRASLECRFCAPATNEMAHDGTPTRRRTPRASRFGRTGGHTRGRTGGRLIKQMTKATTTQDTSSTPSHTLGDTNSTSSSSSSSPPHGPQHILSASPQAHVVLGVSTPHTPVTPSSVPQSPPVDPVPFAGLGTLPPPGSRDTNDKNKIWIYPSSAKLDFQPSDGGIARAITKIIKSKFEGPWPTWRKVDPNVKNLWFTKFEKSYKWLPEHKNQIRCIFDHKGSNIMKNFMNKLRTGHDKGLWMSPKVKAGLQAHWAGDEFKKKSTIGKRNRALDSGAAIYTGGSISAVAHRDRMAVELDRIPTAYDIMERTKKSKAGEWVNEKAKAIADEFLRRRVEATSQVEVEVEGEGAKHSLTTDNAIYMEVVGGLSKKGHVYGLGALGKEFASGSYKRGSATPTPDYVKIITNLTKEIVEKDTRIESMEHTLAEKTTQIETMKMDLHQTQSSLTMTQTVLQQLMEHVGFQSTIPIRPQPQ
ncbi:hypothetical protein RJT34_22819 [Clitoria ternatea]|uniref:Transposase, Ptta/En/Spm, plant n=1 Tax=Clitoria ternatea TaxID=43366 RepID=A0AAN9FJT7_CLITE